MKKIGLIFPVYIVMIIVIFLLPFFSFDNYSILKNTTSQLGAQNTPNAFIMNIVFCLLGLTSILEGWIFLKNFWFHKIIITIFGLSLICTAIFQHAPIKAGIPFNALEDELHSLFASICGFSFTTFAISSSFIESTILRKISALSVGISATLLSILIFNVPNYAGIWQRLIFILSFVWLIFFFEKRRT